MVSVTMICFTMMVAVASAATFSGMLPQKPREHAHKEGCYIKEIDDVIPFGGDISVLGSCFRIECSRHRLYFDSCGTVSTDDPNCFIRDVDVSQPFPDCCPDIQCELDNNI